MKNNITIEQIMEMLDSNIIHVWQEIGDESAKCQIGEYWFYFTSIEENECLENFATDELAEMILNVISNPYENGLGEAEAEYYQSIIIERSKKMEKSTVKVFLNKETGEIWFIIKINGDSEGFEEFIDTVVEDYERLAEEYGEDDMTIDDFLDIQLHKSKFNTTYIGFDEFYI